MQASLYYFYLFIRRLGIAALLFFICRILFFLYNSEFFPDWSVMDFVYGFLFDFSAIAWIYLPFLVFQTAPFPFRKHRLYRMFLKLLFHLSNTICLVLNLIDLEFFEFTLRRSTTDVFAMFSDTGEFINLLPEFVKDYWMTFLLLPALIALSEYLYKKSEPKPHPLKFSFLVQLSLFAISFAIVVVLSRGGIQLRPIGFITANQLTLPQNVPLVLNTPFSFMKSLNKKGLEQKNYFPESELSHVFDPKTQPVNNNKMTKKNVVVIILESFSKEYVGAYNNGKGYTPFLDSLMQHSTVFTNAFANGKRSIESLPAIFSGIPNLMNEAYITSPYAGNNIGSLIKLLKKEGYKSAFYHGGNNGTMGFDAYAEIAGFEEYFGRSEYKNDEDYDGSWGIYDEPFFQFFKKQLDRTPEPFICGIFSLSSHHPYALPEKLRGKFPMGNLPIHPTIGYTDYALRHFFDSAKQAEWFKHTLFIITADHTAQSKHPFYQNLVGSYAIPLILYDPFADSTIHITTTSQQCDIQSIVLNQLSYSKAYFSFGKLPTNNGNNSYNITLNNGIYQFIYENHVMHFDGEQVKAFYDLSTDSLLQFNLKDENLALMRKMERSVKGIIQAYNNRMITNKMYLSNEE